MCFHCMSVVMFEHCMSRKVWTTCVKLNIQCVNSGQYSDHYSLHLSLLYSCMGKFTCLHYGFLGVPYAGRPLCFASACFISFFHITEDRFVKLSWMSYGMWVPLEFNGVRLKNVCPGSAFLNNEKMALFVRVINCAPRVRQVKQ